MQGSPVEEIKNRLNIVDVLGNYIKLQKAGANYRALCPFHSDKKPSFFVSPVRQIWHCFGCGLGGDAFKFVMQIENVEFGDALRILAQKAGVELKREDPELRTQRQRLYEILETACLFYEKQLKESAAGKEALDYLVKRGISEDSVRQWRLGYSPLAWQGLSDFLVGRGYKREEVVSAGLAIKSEKGGNPYDRFRARIIFPVFNLGSQVIGFGGRVFKETKRPDGQEEAKYINSPATMLYDKSRVLYGLNSAGKTIREKNGFALVEGYTDVIIAHQNGFSNVVATSGTALTSYQLDILKRYSLNLFTAFDMDVAGDSATKRGIELAQQAGFNIKVVRLADGLDPADVISQNPQDWKTAVENAKTIHDFYFDSALAQFDKNTLEGKKAISKILLPVIKKIPNKIEQTIWVKDLAHALGVGNEDVAEELKKTRVDRTEYLEVEKTASLAKPIKKRKELLEEDIVSLIIKAPENLVLVGDQDMPLFCNNISKIIGCFKEKGVALADSALPPELKEAYNYLCFKGETHEFESPLSPQDEFKSCLREFRLLSIRDKLDNISKEIKKAENEQNPQKLQQLVQEFNQSSRSLRELETA